MMKVVKLSRFDEELGVIVQFIAQDSMVRALEFFDTLIEKIHEIPQYPYAYRQREASQDEKTRELIFKGYSVPFLIDEENNSIVVLGIFNQNLWS